MKKCLQKIISPTIMNSWVSNLFIAFPRIITGLLLAFEFGASKFGMPWSGKPELKLLYVAEWFPEDIEKFGFPFSLAPRFFAWLGAATEAIGGLLFALGFATRIFAVLISVTMLTAIFFQKWPDALEYGSSWPLLPAMGFLWVALHNVIT